MKSFASVRTKLYTASTAQVRRESTAREKVLEAAQLLFSANGYRGTSTKEIARQAGVAEVTLFRHFPSKEILLEEVMGRFTFLYVFKEIIPHISELPYEEGLAVLANHLLALLKYLKGWIQVMHQELQCSSTRLLPLYRSFLDDLFHSIGDYFRIMQQKGAMVVCDPDIAARSFHGMFYSYFAIEEMLLKRNPDAESQDRVIMEFVTVFFRGTKALSM